MRAGFYQSPEKVPIEKNAVRDEDDLLRDARRVCLVNHCDDVGMQQRLSVAVQVEGLELPALQLAEDIPEASIHAHLLLRVSF